MKTFDKSIRKRQMKLLATTFLLLASALPSAAEDCNIYSEQGQPALTSTASLILDEKGIINGLIVRSNGTELRYKVYRPNLARPELEAVLETDPNGKGISLIKTPGAVILQYRTFDLYCGK